MSFVVRRPDPDKPDSIKSDQAEGHIQIEQPGNVSVSLSKLGDLFFLLGSNDRLYWWIDRSESSDPVVLFGRHELAGPRTLEWLGVSLAPLEFVDLMGITPLDPAAPAVVRVREDGTTAVTVPSRFGYRTLVFDAEDVLRGVELSDLEGGTAVRSELGRDRRVPVRGEGQPGEFMGTRIRLFVPSEDVSISIELAEQVNKDLNPAAFDLERLVRAYAKNARIYDLDAPPEPALESEPIDAAPGSGPVSLGPAG